MLANPATPKLREQARSYRRRVENREAFSTVLLHWWKAFGVFHPTLQLYLSALLISRDNRPHKRRPHEGRPSGSCEEPLMSSNDRVIIFDTTLRDGE
uniref:hypothetical protein n=1 Tax=Stutzerimonas nitrititolerans TaxID=2482751 RepID=UPI0028AA6E80